MATNRWLGHSPAVAQVATLVVGSTTNGHTFLTTINGKSITYTAGAGETTSTIASAIQALLAASDIPEFSEITWTVSTATITATAATAGVPFTLSESGTGTYTLTAVTASSGPNHIDDTGNWSAGTLPVATNDILIDGGADILYGYENISAAAYNSFRMKASFTGKQGLPFRNENGGYVEYRTRAWPIDDAVPVTIGEGDGQGPQRVVLSCGTNLALTVLKTQPRGSDAIPVVNVYGSTAGTFSIASGDLGLAADNDTTSLSGVTGSVDGDATLTVGNGATVATLTHAAGTTNSQGTITTLNITGGTATLYRTSTTITADGACVVDIRGTGTYATVTARGQGSGKSPLIECGNNPRTKTFTNHTVTGGAVLHDPDKTVVMTNAGTWDRESLAASDLGARFTMTRT